MLLEHRPREDSVDLVKRTANRTQPQRRVRTIIRKRITSGGWRPGFAAANVVKLLIAMADSAIGPTDYLFAMPNRYGVIVIGNPQHAIGLSHWEFA